MTRPSRPSRPTEPARPTRPARTSRSVRRSTALVALSALALSAYGCGDVDAPAADAVDVSLVDFAFEGLPDEVPSGTRLTVTNDATTELHELVAFRLPDDEQRSIAELVQLPPPELIATLGEPATVLLAEPGGPQIAAVGDGTLDETGRYAIVCFIPTGVEPQTYLTAAAETDEGPPQVEGGPPHIVHGMHAELVVR